MIISLLSTTIFRNFVMSGECYIFFIYSGMSTSDNNLLAFSRFPLIANFPINSSDLKRFPYDLEWFPYDSISYWILLTISSKLFVNRKI